MKENAKQEGSFEHYKTLINLNVSNWTKFSCQQNSCKPITRHSPRAELGQMMQTKNFHIRKDLGQSFLWGGTRMVWGWDVEALGATGGGIFCLFKEEFGGSCAE